MGQFRRVLMMVYNNDVEQCCGSDRSRTVGRSLSQFASKACCPLENTDIEEGTFGMGSQV